MGANSSPSDPDGSVARPTPDPVRVPLTVSGVHKSFGVDEVLDGVTLDVQPGELLTLLGPSGCGKTTLLRVIAGLERPDAGEVRFAERLLVGDDTFVTPDKRGIGLVFQDGALFPHLDVGANVAYGLNKLSRSERRARTHDALELVGLRGLDERSPSTLSGGQQQRVALARALAPRPQVLLLDEPFSNLDASLRRQLRTELHGLLADLGITTVFVTHDQEEAFVLGDRVAVLRDGRVVQVADPAALYLAPVDRWVARFVGATNLLRGTMVASGGAAETAVGRVPLAASDASASAVSADVEVLVRPEWLGVTTIGGEGDRRDDDVWATVGLVEFRGADTAYELLLGGSGDEAVPIHAIEPGVPTHARGDRVSIRYIGPPSVAYLVSSDDRDAAGAH